MKKYFPKRLLLVVILTVPLLSGPLFVNAQDYYSDYGAYDYYNDYGSYDYFSDYGSYDNYFSDYGSYDSYFSDYNSYDYFGDYNSSDYFSDYNSYDYFNDYSSYDYFGDYNSYDYFNDYSSYDYFGDYNSYDYFNDYSSYDYFNDYNSSDYFSDYNSYDYFNDYNSYDYFNDYNSYDYFNDYSSYDYYNDYNSYDYFNDYTAYDYYNDYNSYDYYNDYNVYDYFSDYNSYDYYNDYYNDYQTDYFQTYDYSNYYPQYDQYGYCENCGYQYPYSSEYCQNCGYYNQPYYYQYTPGGFYGSFGYVGGTQNTYPQYITINKQCNQPSCQQNYVYPVIQYPTCTGTSCVAEEKCYDCPSETEEVVYSYYQVPVVANTSVQTSEALSVEVLVKKESDSDDGWVKNLSVNTGEKINFMVTVSNSSNKTINDVDVILNIPEEIKMVGDIDIDGEKKAEDISTGITVGSIKANDAKVIAFDAEINQNKFEDNETKELAIEGKASTEQYSALDNITIVSENTVSQNMAAASKSSFLKYWYLWFLVILIIVLLGFLFNKYYLSH